MIFPLNRVQIVVANQPVDFRKGHDLLAASVQSEPRQGPFNRNAFVFRSKRTDWLKFLCWNSIGLVMTDNRLEETKFTSPAIRDGLMSLNRTQFEALRPAYDPLMADLKT